MITVLLSGCGLFQRNNVQSYASSTLAPAPTRDIDTASRLRVAQAAEAAGNLDIALSMYGAAAAAEPSRPDLQARFAAVLSRTGQTARADEVLSSALARFPNDDALLTQLGRHRLRAGAAEQALGLFDRVLARDGRNADALDGRGVALDLLDRPSEAQQAYRAGLVVAPSDLRLVGNLAFSYLLEGRAQEARDVLEPHAGRSEIPARMRTSLAIARSMTGARDAAMALLGPDVTGQDLDQLVASLPAARAAVRSRAAQPVAPISEAPMPVAAASPPAAPTAVIAAVAPAVAAAPAPPPAAERRQRALSIVDPVSTEPLPPAAQAESASAGPAAGGSFVPYSDALPGRGRGPRASAARDTAPALTPPSAEPPLTTVPLAAAAPAAAAISPGGEAASSQGFVPYSDLVRERSRAGRTEGGRRPAP